MCESDNRNLNAAPDEAPADVPEDLQGWLPPFDKPAEIRAALEKAFDYRGDVTITTAAGERIEGYVFDRRSQGPGLDQAWVRIIPKSGATKVSVRFSEISRLEFTGRDTAAGKNFQRWLKRYAESKARGERHVSLEPESLE